MKKVFSLVFLSIITSSMLSAHVGHNPLDHGGFHFLFSTAHGAWILLAISSVIGLRILFMKQNRGAKHA